MGWQNPPIPWSQFERTLSDRRRPRQMPVNADGGDSPAWSLRRGPYVPQNIVRDPDALPYAELHAHSSYSFLDGASSPEELLEEAERLGLHALAITDHDGFYGIVRFAEAAETASVKTVFGAELSLGLSEPQNGEADPEGTHLLVLARQEEGYHRLASAITEGQLRGAEKGRPIYDLDELAAHAGGHWVVLTGCRKGAVRQALASTSPTADPGSELDKLVDLFGRENVYVELIDHGNPLDTDHNDALAALAAERATPGHRDRQRALRLPRSAAPRDGCRRRAREPQPRRAGRVAARRGHRAPQIGTRDARPVRPVSRSRRAHRHPRRRARVPAATREARPAEAAGAGGAHADVVAAAAGLGCRAGQVPRPHRRRPGAHRGRARRDRDEGLPRLLPDRARHRRVRAQPGDPLPGPRIGRQLGGLLPAQHHRRRLDLLQAAVRAVPVVVARRRARHRCRLRLRPPRRGHPVGVREVRAPQRRPGRQRHPVPAEERGARHGEGARALARAAGRLVEAGGALGRRAHRRATTTTSRPASSSSRCSC